MLLAVNVPAIAACARHSHLHKSHDDILSLHRFGTDAMYACEMGAHGLQGIDMWSVGCILGEILGGKAMFQGRVPWTERRGAAGITTYRARVHYTVEQRRSRTVRTSE